MNQITVLFGGVDKSALKKRLKKDLRISGPITSSRDRGVRKLPDVASRGVLGDEVPEELEVPNRGRPGDVQPAGKVESLRVIEGIELHPRATLRHFAEYATTHSGEQQSCADRQSRIFFVKGLPQPAQMRLTRGAPMFPETLRQGVAVLWPT